MTSICDQWIRKVGLFVTSGSNALDLSEFRIRFDIRNADVEHPNNAVIRVYNLSLQTINQIKSFEFSSVVLNAGYEGGNYGVIFQGTVKQFRTGKENARDTYLDILAADGDIGYNYGFISTPIAKNTKVIDKLKQIIGTMPGIGVGYLPSTDAMYRTAIRGSVEFGMARASLRNIATTLDATWSIQDGKVNVVPLTGYINDNSVVKLNRDTGLVGLPEQTDQGIKIQCLLNSKLRIGSLVQLDEDQINRIENQRNNNTLMPYDQWTGIQYISPLSKSGIYRCYVVEHEGDTRGNPWYSNIIGLSVDISSGTVKAKQ